MERLHNDKRGDMNEYRQKIRIGRNVTNIMKLPCVFSCHKEGDDRLCYLLYDWDEFGNYIEARMGDWLCEDHDGRWHVEKAKRERKP